MDLLSAFLGRNGYLPHGYCFTWSPQLLWTMVAADMSIAAAYFSIPLAIFSYVRRRGASPVNGVAWLFVGFIFACGITHVMDVWTIWQADYGAQAIAKVATAVVSVVTAVALWRLIPRALKLPSTQQLQDAVSGLESEVAKRRSAEQVLAETDQSLAITLASIGAGFINTDRRGCIARMNAVAESVTGWSQDEARGKPLWEVFERENQPADAVVRNAVDDMIERGVSVDLPLNLVAIRRGADTDHTRRSTLEVKAALIRDVGVSGPGAVRGLTMVFRDLTSLQFAQAEATRLAAIVASSNDAIIGKSLDDLVTSWNPAAEAMFGYTAAEMLGQPIDLLVPPQHAAEELSVLALLARGDRVPAFDTERRTRDGRLIDVSITMSPIRDRHGNIVGASKFLRDISESRRVQAALKESETRLRLTLEAAQIGDWSLDLATGAIQHSLQHDRCFGYEAPVDGWTAQSFFEHVHPQDRPAVQQVLNRTSGNASRRWELECRVIWPDGSVHWLRVHAAVLQNDGDGVRMLGVVADITMRKRDEEARHEAQRLEQENREIQQASRMKSLFLANMSHELRTPLNAIIGFADLLRMNVVAPDSPKHPEYLGHIASSGRHLLNLVNDVLDLSRVEAGKFNFLPAPVSLSDLANEVRDTLAEPLRSKHIDCVLDLDPATDALTLDPVRLKQVLYNYLTNAIKFTHEGGRVTLRSRPEGAQRIRIEVEDTGIGIDASDLPLLFQEFRQLEAGQALGAKGSGLGLALTRRLVEAQGGQVGVRSEPGRGSVFHLVLPREPAMAARQRLLMIGETIVKGDDESASRAQLEQAGYAVDAASTGADALQRIGRRGYDAFTLDLHLPDRRGLEILQRIRSGTSNRDSAVLGMALSVANDGAVAFAISDVLSKPLEHAEVVGAMLRVPEPPGRARRVMVVDDEPLSVQLMQATLQSLGIEASGFGNGPAALEAIDSVQPDALVVDLLMPEMDGLALLDALRRRPEWRRVPVFIWTRMMPSDGEYALLASSAQRIAGAGGGEIRAMLDALCRWHPLPIAAPAISAASNPSGDS